VPKTAVEMWCACLYRSRAFVLTALVFAGCGYSLIHGARVDSKQAVSVEAGVGRIRQLDFTQQVPVVVNTPDQAQQAITTQIARDHSDEDLRIGGESGVMTGLYPPNINLKRQTVELLRNEIIGFYNPDTRQMVMVQRPRSDSSSEVRRLGASMGTMVLAHELTHALQDQHFAIEKMLKQVKDNDDQTLALKCVAEGDATLSGFAYVAGRMEPANVESLVNQLSALPASSASQGHDIPLAITVPMLFEYSGGSRFVAEAWRRGGWSAVDQLYRNPPRSSQQIMQPELYFDRPTPPVRIELTGYESLLSDWKKVDDDTYGELLLKLIFERNLPPHASAFRTLPEWAGDRIITLQKGKQLTLLWLIAFHDPAAAAEFARAYSQVLDHLAVKSNPHGVATRATTVFVAIGPGAQDFARLREAVWKASRIMPALREDANKKSEAAVNGKS